MINFIHVSTNSYRSTTINEKNNSEKPLLKNHINKVMSTSEKISSNIKWIAGAGLTLVGVIGTMALAFSSRVTGLDVAHGKIQNAEKTLINNAMSDNSSFSNPTWNQLNNMTNIEVHVVTSKNETFSDSLTIELHRIFAAATSFRDFARAMLFDDYMKLKAEAGPGGIKSFFFHSIGIAISKGKEIATSFNELIINNAKHRNFSPQDIDEMKKIVDRLTDEVQHLEGYKDDIGKRMRKKSDFGPNTARKWHNYFQSSFNKIDEMINALLAFKH